MPTITVPADTYARLAAERGTAVEAVALPLLLFRPRPATTCCRPRRSSGGRRGVRSCSGSAAN